ncbi:MAG: phosphonopyruvate decarboxylase [Planctomycetes bacterium]|nr:phosphonopyruvate decarboxylase [Planctomycetota bacterium]
MIRADEVVQLFHRAGFGLFTGVPCSYLTPLIDAVIDSKDIRYVGAANEGEAVAIAAGARLGGRESVVMFQNSGLGNAVNPLTSLTYSFRLPVLVVTTWRGEPEGEPDEPQHEVMGEITPRLLELMKIPWELFPSDASALEAALARAQAYMAEQRLPYAFIVQKNAIEAAATGKHRTRERLSSGSVRGSLGARLDPDATMRALVAGVSGSDVVVATTGYTGRALYAVGDRPNQLYMVGSMGCASSFALGLALTQPQRRVVVLDGDGALLMHLGALAIVGHEAPPNLVHVLLDNGVHDSTGAQATVAPAVDLAGVALACGYPDVRRVASAGALTEAVGRAGRERAGGPAFLHVRTEPRTNRKLPRPSETPPEVAERLATWMRTHV